MANVVAPDNPTPRGEEQGESNPKDRRIARYVFAIACAIPVIWLGLYTWGGRGYADREQLRGLMLRARADAERLLEGKGAIPSNPERADWSLKDQNAHPLLKSYTIENDGTIRLVLRGNEVLENKVLILTPTIGGGAVKWACTTDIPMRFRANECRNAAHQ